LNGLERDAILPVIAGLAVGILLIFVIAQVMTNVQTNVNIVEWYSTTMVVKVQCLPFKAGIFDRPVPSLCTFGLVDELGRHYGVIQNKESEKLFATADKSNKGFRVKGNVSHPPPESMKQYDIVGVIEIGSFIRLDQEADGAESKLSTIKCEQSSLFCTYQLFVGNRTYLMNFRFNGTIENMTANTTTQTLTIGLDGQSSSNLTIAIPREVVDSRAGSDRKSGADTDFAVFLDEENGESFEYSPQDEKWANALGITDHPESYRILVIPIKEGTERVDIVGTWEI
jgi:hypothetical protein